MGNTEAPICNIRKKEIDTEEGCPYGTAQNSKVNSFLNSMQIIEFNHIDVGGYHI
jgi:hypothetical protein